mgnify:CR=1 FL=1
MKKLTAATDPQKEKQEGIRGERERERERKSSLVASGPTTKSQGEGGEVKIEMKSPAGAT